jgi:putative salt-induced outer membrane protein
MMVNARRQTGGIVEPSVTGVALMFKFFVQGLLFAFLLSSVLQAGVVELENGDRLTGKILSLRSNKLVVETAYAGKVTIAFDHVIRLETEDQVMVEFANGKRAEGIIRLREHLLELEGEELLTSYREQIASIELPPEPGRDPNIFQAWRGNADFGYTINRGNTEQSNMAISFQPERRTENDRIHGRYQSIYSVRNGETVSNLFKGRLRYDYFLSPRVFVFGTGEVEKDERELLNLRTRQGGGFGLRIRPNQVTHLAIFGGFTFLQEDYQNSGRELGAEALGGIELETRIFSPVVVTSKGQILPILTEDRYLVEFDAGARVPLFAGLTFGVQFFDSFDSRPRPGIKRNDFGLFSTLGFTF